MDWPSPTIARSWQDWAASLVQALRRRQDRNVELPRYTVAMLPRAVEDGTLVFVTDETDGPTVAVSVGGVWKRVQDMVIVS